MIDDDLTEVFEKVGCFPHQASFAAKFFKDNSPKTHVLIGPPGAGKGFVAAAICAHAWFNDQAKQILILSPARLVKYWLDTIRSRQPTLPVVVINRRRFRELEASAKEGELPWPRNGIVIVSFDFAKQQNVAKSLADATWDILVIDEAHQLAGKSRRRELAVNLIEGHLDARALLLCAEGLSSEHFRSSQDDRLLVGADVTVWSRESVRDKDGNPLLPDVHIHWVTYYRTSDEVALLSKVQDLIRALRLNRPSDRMLATVLLKSSSSSMFALEQRLNRILQRHNQKFDERILDDVPSIEPDDLTNDDSAIQQPEFTELVNQLLEEIENVERDSKCEALLQVLDSIGTQAVQDHRVCIFTRFVDTSTFLLSALVESFPCVFRLTGSHSSEERQRIIQQFESNGGIMIATETVSTMFPEVTAVIFYDVPWDPAIVDAHVGHFVRYGRKGPVRVIAFNDDTDTLAIERVQRKVAEIKEAVGESDLHNLLFSDVIDVTDYLSNGNE